MSSSSLDEIVRRNRELIKAVRRHIAASRELREASKDLSQQRADLRECLQDNLLNTWSLRERWIEK